MSEEAEYILYHIFSWRVFFHFLRLSYVALMLCVTAMLHLASIHSASAPWLVRRCARNPPVLVQQPFRPDCNFFFFHPRPLPCKPFFCVAVNSRCHVWFFFRHDRLLLCLCFCQRKTTLLVAADRFDENSAALPSATISVPTDPVLSNGYLLFILRPTVSSSIMFYRSSCHICRMITHWHRKSIINTLIPAKESS